MVERKLHAEGPGSERRAERRTARGTAHGAAHGRVVGRLAPTPSGRLHLGNVCAFAAAWLSVRAQDGHLLLRIEDVDRPRANAIVEEGLRQDLAWLGLHWDAETPRQSTRDYATALAALGLPGPRLQGLGVQGLGLEGLSAPAAEALPHSLTYYCDCTREQIRHAGGVYSGRCRTRGLHEGAVRFRLPDEPLAFVDRARGPHVTDLRAMGDPVLRRRDGVYAYSLAVVADDIADAVTEVVRGEDLLDQSAVQICLWRALDAGRAAPTWLHTPLVLGSDGRKLSKSHASAHIGALRAAGWTVADVWRHVLPWLGLDPVPRIEDAVAGFTPSAIRRGPVAAPLAGAPTYTG